MAEEPNAKMRRRRSRRPRCRSGLGEAVGQQAIQLHGGIGMTRSTRSGLLQAARPDRYAVSGDADHHLAGSPGSAARAATEGGADLSPHSARGDLKNASAAFREEHVMPDRADLSRTAEKAADRWDAPPIMNELKQNANAQVCEPVHAQAPDPNALSTLEYAPLCEIMGRSPIGAEPFNCSAPDTAT